MTRPRIIISGACLLLFIGILLYSNWHGLSSTFDSSNYIHAAQTYANEGIMKEVSGNSLVHYPPLYPFILSIFPANPIPFAAFLNIFALTFSFILWAFISHRLLLSNIFFTLFLLLLAFSTPWLLIGHFVWSEPVFILLFSLYIFLIFQYMHKLKSSHLLLAIICGFLLPLQRTAGVFILVGAGIALIFLFSHNRKSLLVIITHLLLSMSGFILWFLQKNPVQNRLAADPIFTDPTLLLNHLLLNLKTLGIWIFPPLNIQIATVVGATLFIVLIIFSSKKQVESCILLSVTIFYFLAFTILPVIFSFGSVDDPERYFSVIYAPFFLLTLKLIDQNLLFKRKIWMLLLFLWLLYPTARTIKNSIFFHERKYVVQDLRR